jgi:lipopolysaccharide export system protein LptA
MTTLALAAWVLCHAGAAVAEQADFEKPTVIEYDRSVGDELNQIVTFTGNVRLTRGTLVLTGERMEVQQSPDGYKTVVISGGQEKLATYRQRLDQRLQGIEEHIEGRAERLEYDERSDTVRLVGQANLKRLENAVPQDEVSGKLIVYDIAGRTTTIDGRSSHADSRGRMIIAPLRDAEHKGAKSPGVPLKTERSTGTPGK